MLDAILSLFGAAIVSIGSLIIWSILLGKKLNFKDWKIYLIVLATTLVLYFNFNNLLKFTFCTLLFTIIIKYLFKEKFSTSLITASFTQTINVIAEFIYSILIIFVLKLDFDSTNISEYIVFFADLFVSVCGILLVKIKFIRKFYNMILNVIRKLKLKYILIMFFSIIFVVNAYIQLTYYKINTFYVFLLNNLSIYIIVIIVTILARKENQYIRIYDKYNNTLNSLKEYEDILDKYRISNHENKNQLLTIRNMISDKNKKVSNYIDEIVKAKIQDDEKLMQEVSVIPVGGLRGLVYSKILYMKENQIKYDLNISKDIRTVDLISKIDDSDMLDVCQIIGVYIDNAIDAVKDLKEKYINIEMYLDNNDLIFSVSNFYKGVIEIDKLEEKGYTTKGSGHGYGLSLTKKIIDNNKKLSNEKKLSKEIFTQALRIKLK